MTGVPLWTWFFWFWGVVLGFLLIPVVKTTGLENMVDEGVRLARYLGLPDSQMTGWELIELYRKYEGRTLGVATGNEIHVRAKRTWKSLAYAMVTAQ